MSDPNVAPVALDDTNLILQGAGSIAGNVLSNDSDPDGDTLASGSIQSLSTGDFVGFDSPGQSFSISGLYGRLQFNGDGSYAYAPNYSRADVNGLSDGHSLEEVFIYTASDGLLRSNSARLTITIEGTDHPGVAVDDAASIQKGQLTVAGNLLANDTDPDGDTLGSGSIQSLSTGDFVGFDFPGQSFDIHGLYGTLHLDGNGGYSYAPNYARSDVSDLAPGSSLEDVFIYTSSDGHVRSNSARLTVTITGDVTIDPVNEPPTEVLAVPLGSTSVPVGYTISAPIHVARLDVFDDSFGSNAMTLTGTDSGLFTLAEDGGQLFLDLLPDATAALAAPNTISVTVNVDDPGVGGAVDAATTFSVSSAAPSPDDYLPLLTPFPIWPTPVITYSFELFGVFFGAGHPFTDADKAVARDALAAWDAASGVVFVEVASGTGELRFQLAELGGAVAGQAEFPVDVSGFESIGIDLGARADFRVWAHEIGHGLGLQHPFAEQGHFGSVVAPAFNNTNFTVMANAHGFTAPTTIGPLDRNAVQALYGSPDQGTYTFDPATRVFTYTGSAGDDEIFGNRRLINILDGGAGNDALHAIGSARLTGGAGDDALFATNGFSFVAVYSGSRDDYSFEFVSDPLGATSDFIRVTDTRPGSPDGTDGIFTVDNVEFEFAGRPGTIAQADIEFTVDGINPVTSFSVSENAPGFTTVGQILRVDVDLPAGFPERPLQSISLVDSGGGPFQLVSNDLMIADPLDFEQTQFYNLMFRVVDGYGGMHDETIRVDVIDEIDPVFPQPIFGTDEADTIVGTPGDDMIFQTLGSDSIDGSEGNDTFNLAFNLSDYVLGRNADGSVSFSYDVTFAEERFTGTDTVRNAEIFTFANGATRTFSDLFNRAPEPVADTFELTEDGHGRQFLPAALHDLPLRAVDGTPESLGQLQGLTLISVCPIWCLPCRGFSADSAQLQSQLAALGVSVLEIIIDDDRPGNAIVATAEDAATWIQQTGSVFETWHVDGSVPVADTLFGALGITGFPHYVLYDPAGNRIVSTFEGYTGVQDFVRDIAHTLADDASGGPSSAALSGNVIYGAVETDGDPDGDFLQVSAVNGDPTLVGTTFTLASGARLTVDPNGQFKLDPHGAYDHLSATQSTTEAFTYTVSDGHGGAASTTVTFDFAGANDLATFHGDSNGNVSEDVPSTGGVLSATDPDDRQSGSPPFQSETVTGTYGHLQIEATGAWTYTLDPSVLPALQALTALSTPVPDTLTVHAFDGTAADIHISIFGADDPAVIGGIATGTVEKNGGLVATGALTISDPDAGQEHFVAGTYSNISPKDPGTGYGQLELAADGQWTYTLDPTLPQVQALLAGQHASDTFTVFAADGTAQTIDITIEAGAGAPVGQDDSYSTNEDITLNVAAPGVLANDADADGDPLTAALVSGPSHGALTFNGDGSFAYTPAPDYSGPDAFSYQTNDGTFDSNVATVSLTVVQVNAAPVLANAGPAASSLEQTTLLLDADIAVSDEELDSAKSQLGDYSGASLTVGRQLGPNAEDLFGFAASASFTVNDTVPGSGELRAGSLAFASFTNAGGALIVTFTSAETLATSALVNEVLQHVTYANQSDAPPPAVELLYTFNDGNSGVQGTGGNGIANATVSVELTPLNDAPLSTVPGAQTVSSGSPLAFSAATHSAISVLDADADPTVDDIQMNISVTDGRAILTLRTDVVGGVEPADVLFNGSQFLIVIATQDQINATLAAPDGLTYVAPPNFVGSELLTISVNDLGHTGEPAPRSSFSTVPITVTSVAPISGDDSFTTNEDVGVTVAAPGVLGNDRDADGGSLTAVLVSDPSHGSLTLNGDGSFKYTPAPDYNGPDAFTYKANDGTFDGNVAMVSLTVIPRDEVNAAPVLANVGPTASSLEQTSVFLDPDIAISDEELDILNNAAGDYAGASLTVARQVGPDAEDLFGFATNTGFAVDDTGPGTGEIRVGGLTFATFSIAGGALAVNFTSSETAATSALVNEVARQVTYVNLSDTPPPTVDMEYTLSDGNAGAQGVGGIGSARGIVPVILAPLNDAPVNTVPGAQLIAASQPLVFSAATNNAISVFDADANPSTDDIRVNISVTDGRAILTLRTDVVGGVEPADVLFNGSQFVVVIATQDQINATLAAPNGLTYIAPPTFVGSEVLTVGTSDLGHNGFLLLPDGDLTTGPGSSASTIGITVVKPAEALGDHYQATEDATLTVPVADGVLANDRAASGGPLTAVPVSGPSHGSLTLSSDGSFTYTPSLDYNGPDAFSYKALDGTVASDVATVNLNIAPQNDAPTASGDSYTLDEDQPGGLSVSLPDGVLANDTDIDSLSLSAAPLSLPAHGTLVAFSGDGSFLYVPDLDYNGTDAFTYEVTDGSEHDTATVSLTIKSVNDAPVSGDESYTSVEDVALTVTAAQGVLRNDSDPDGDGSALQAHVIEKPAHGSVSLNPDGSFTYTPEPNYFGPDSFKYRANDGIVDGNTATVSLQISAVDDAPVAVNDTYVTNEDTALLISQPGVLANDFDVDGVPLEAITISKPTHGLLTLTSNGSFSYVPDSNYNGLDSFTYRVQGGNVATVALTINPTKDAPVITSGGGAESAVVVVSENTQPVTTVHATDTDGDKVVYSISGGVDQGRFKIAADTGILSFINAPDFETPKDSDGDNSYMVEVAASDGTLVDRQTISVKVGNAFGLLLGGGPQPDTLIGTSENDFISGLQGDDTLFGLADNDTLDGGTANDVLHGGAGDDVLRGDYGLDKLFGDEGNDVLDGGPGIDAMTGGPGDDTYIVDNIAESVTERSAEGTDTVQTVVRIYTLPSNVENLVGTATTGQVLVGNSLSNTIVGGAGNDTIFGVAGPDVLIGGPGNDRLVGGPESDTFVLNTPKEGVDTINGFVSGIDHFRISALGFGGGLTAGGSVTLVETSSIGAASSGSHGYFILDNAGPASGTLYWDQTGGNSRDAQAIAVLTGVTHLAAGDILLV